MTNKDAADVWISYSVACQHIFCTINDLSNDVDNEVIAGLPKTSHLELLRHELRKLLINSTYASLVCNAEASKFLSLSEDQQAKE